MGTSRTSTEKQTTSTAPVAGVAEVMTVGVRVAGRVPTRVDLRPAGTAEQLLGLSLGTVLIYLNSHRAARTVALAWVRPRRWRGRCPQRCLLRVVRSWRPVRGP